MMQAKPDALVILTIDAGGTTVRFRLQRGQDFLCDDWSVPANNSGHPPQFIDAAIRPDVIVAGITKVSRPGIVNAWEQACMARFPGVKSIIVPDFELAAAAALDSPHGVMLLAGTGSLACAYDGQILHRVGGRGWEYGDEGSGAFITSELVRRCVRALDGIYPVSPLLKSTIDLSCTSDAGEFATWARDRAETHGRGFLIPHIGSEADRANQEAINLFHGAGGWLARLAHTAHQRTKGTTNRISVCAVGGLWDAGPFLQDATIRALTKWFDDVEYSRFVGSNLSGGIRLALCRFEATS
ncbi:MAG: BadF/BadG/BcrA/BcrD ATPase family protein [Armatimonadota bacterium]